MSKKKEKKNKKGKKVNISLFLSITAIVISIFSLPVVNKTFEKAKIDIIDLGLMRTSDSILEKNYLLINNSGNTAKNIELHVKELDSHRNIFFREDSFTLKKDDKLGGISQNKVYEMKEFSSGEKVRVVIYVNFKNYLKINNIDTLIIDKPIAKPQSYYGPYIKKIKHSDGIERPKYDRFIELKKLSF
jgi:hypothetical protein